MIENYAESYKIQLEGILKNSSKKRILALSDKQIEKLNDAGLIGCILGHKDNVTGSTSDKFCNLFLKYDSYFKHLLELLNKCNLEKEEKTIISYFDKVLLKQYDESKRSIGKNFF